MTLVVVSGAIANKPGQGGEAWVRLSYLLGLKRLGYDVHFLEQIAPATCVDAAGRPVPLAQSVNQAYFDRVLDDFGLRDSATLISDSATPHAALVDLAERAGALVNVSGHLAIEELFPRFRRKIFLDIDPGYTQFWHAEGNAGARLAGHDAYFTIGENIGRATCPIPTGEISWRTTRPPVVLDAWPAVAPPEAPRFTTVANWRGAYGGVQFGGRTYGLKVHEFRKFLELPRRSDAPFEIALNIHPADHKDLDALRSAGWTILDPIGVCASPADFRRYVQTSGGEFSAAQGIYVETNCGWFSDRTAKYLASARPVLVQETGFSDFLPTGEGLVSFRTLDEAVAGAHAIASDYARHCRAARAIAEEYFDSDKILGRLMGEIGVAP